MSTTSGGSLAHAKFTNESGEVFELQYNPKEPLTVAQRGCVDHIMKGGHHLLELINEVLDLSMIEMGKMELTLKPVDLHDLCDESCTLITPLADKMGIHLELLPCNRPINILADRTRLKQVILNLGSNAIKYNRKDGSVYMSCNENSEGQLHITVRDTGPGIEPSRLNELFEPFNRLGEETGKTEGTGIGLVITRELVEMMGFTLGIDSVVGEGSAFWIDIPQNI